MELDKEELADFKQMISMFVLLYKTIWSEVEKQFSDLPQEEKHKIFSVIAPSIVNMFNSAGDEIEIEKTKPKKGKQQKRR